MKTILLLFGILVSFPQTNLIAQSAKDSLTPKMKIVKEVLYKAENGTLKNRDSLFPSDVNTFMVYDKNEKMIERHRYNPDGTLYEKSFYERNENGDSQKGMKKNSSDKIKSYWTSEYDSNNNLIEVKTYDVDDNLTQTQSNKQDENGNKVETIITDLKRNTIWKYSYAYNENGEQIEQLRYTNGSLKDRRTYNYDENGNEFEQFHYKPDDSITKFVSEYDKMNNLVVQNWFDEQGEQTHQTSFEYVYDENGNWITKKRSSNGVLSMVWERKIEYHE